MALFSSDPETNGQTPPRRPPIWAGSERRAWPDLRLFGRASLYRTRLKAAPAVRSAADGLIRFAARVDDGVWQISPQKVGKLARIVPPKARVADALRVAARVIAQASRSVAPPEPLQGLPIRPWDGAPGSLPVEQAAPPAREPIPAVSLASHIDRPARPARATDAAPTSEDSDRDTLEAIRAAMLQAETRPSRPARRPAPDPVPADPGPRGAGALPPIEPFEPLPPGLIGRMFARLLGFAVIVLALPVGAVSALLAAWRGEDIEPLV